MLSNLDTPPIYLLPRTVTSIFILLNTKYIIDTSLSISLAIETTQSDLPRIFEEEGRGTGGRREGRGKMHGGGGDKVKSNGQVMDIRKTM